jgi:TetR/AcrR family transcriptional regulator, copper-responsive repressor
MKTVMPSRPRGRPRAFDRVAALQKAKRLFWEKGYAGVSVSDLTLELGVSPPSLYAAFGGKRTLFEETVASYLNGEGSFAGQALREESKGRAAIERMLKEAARNFTKPGCPTGCMAVMAATNCADEDRPIADFLSKLRAASERGIENRIRKSMDDGELPAACDVHALAAFYATVFQGMSIKARDGASRKELETIAAAAMKAWPRSS